MRAAGVRVRRKRRKLDSAFWDLFWLEDDEIEEMSMTMNNECVCEQLTRIADYLEGQGGGDIPAIPENVENVAAAIAGFVGAGLLMVPEPRVKAIGGAIIGLSVILDPEAGGLGAGVGALLNPLKGFFKGPSIKFRTFRDSPYFSTSVFDAEADFNGSQERLVTLASHYYFRTRSGFISPDPHGKPGLLSPGDVAISEPTFTKTPTSEWSTLSPVSINEDVINFDGVYPKPCLLYTSPSPRDS